VRRIVLCLPSSTPLPDSAHDWAKQQAAVGRYFGVHPGTEGDEKAATQVFQLSQLSGR
jgi:hypothetical protein